MLKYLKEIRCFPWHFFKGRYNSTLLNPRMLSDEGLYELKFTALSKGGRGKLGSEKEYYYVFFNKEYIEYRLSTLIEPLVSIENLNITFVSGTKIYTLQELRNENHSS